MEEDEEFEDALEGYEKDEEVKKEKFVVLEEETDSDYVDYDDDSDDDGETTDDDKKEDEGMALQERVSTAAMTVGKRNEEVASLIQAQDAKLVKCRESLGPGVIIPRMLSVDGCNIGRAAQGPERLHVDSLALLSIVRFLLVRNFDVAVFIPESYGRVVSPRVIHGDLLQQLEVAGCLSLTTTCAATNSRQAFINYDDLYTLDFALHKGGAIASGDRFRDIRLDKRFAVYHELIEKRQITIDCHLMNELWYTDGIDRIYKVVPVLGLPHWQEETVPALATRLYSNIDDPRDPSALAVRFRRQDYTLPYRRKLLSVIDALMDRFQFPSPLGIPNALKLARRSRTFYRVPAAFRDNAEESVDSEEESFLEDVEEALFCDRDLLDKVDVDEFFRELEQEYLLPSAAGAVPEVVEEAVESEFECLSESDDGWGFSSNMTQEELARARAERVADVEPPWDPTSRVHPEFDERLVALTTSMADVQLAVSVPVSPPPCEETLLPSECPTSTTTDDSGIDVTSPTESEEASDPELFTSLSDDSSDDKSCVRPLDFEDDTEGEGTQPRKKRKSDLW